MKLMGDIDHTTGILSHIDPSKRDLEGSQGQPHDVQPGLNGL